ncbi:MAG: hydrolase [Streptosporangiales bacterium]|nr:hydrolase [Streptosporangiales bacterium]
MRLVTYHSQGTERVGVLDAERELVFGIDAAHDPGAGGVLGLIESWGSVGPRVDAGGDAVPVDKVDLRAPFFPRRNVFCVGKNYREHSTEFARSGFDASDTERRNDVPELPIFFTKSTGSIIGPGVPIDPHPELTSSLDYEAELAVIIGRGGCGIAADRAAEHIWGYTIINDVTARDLQRAHKQWFLGKSLDTFCPMGPWAVTADEVDVTNLAVRCWVNGELRQEGNTGDLIFDVPTLVSTLSAGITLQPGDVIATGTPAGVGIGFRPPRFLGPGDVVSAEITGLGTLTNPVAGT